MRTQHTVDTAALVNAARAGDAAAQDALVGAYLPLVYNIVGRALNGSVDVDDVVQDTMLRALGSLGDLRTPESFRSWLVAIAMNRVRAHWQDRQLAPDAVDEAADVADPGADFVDLTIVRLQLSGQRQETARATRWLEPEDREVLSLWWLECAGELTRAEVAAALGVSPQHTAVRVQRMKARLEAARVVVRALDARPVCEELHGMLASWDGQPSALWRKRMARHARACARCGGLWSGLLPAEGLLAGLALVGVGSALLTTTRSAVAGLTAAGSTAPLPTVAEAAHPAADTAVGDRAAAGADPGAAGPDAGGSGTGASVGLRASRRRSTGRGERGDSGGSGAGPSGALWWRPVWRAAASGTSAPARDRRHASRPPRGPPALPRLTSRNPVPSRPRPRPRPRRPPRRPRRPPRSRAPPRAPRPARTSSTPKAAPAAPATGRASRAPQAQPAPAGTVAQVVALVNKERAAAGCGPVTEDPQLDRAAQGHSDDMAARGFFDHTDPDGDGPGERITAAGYRWSTYGENIAKGQQTPQAVMDSLDEQPRPPRQHPQLLLQEHRRRRPRRRGRPLVDAGLRRQALIPRQGRAALPGVCPKVRRKTSMNALAEDQPHRCATVVTGVPSASRTSAWCSRSWVRHCGNVIPRSRRNSRESVRSLAPTRRPSSASVRPSAGSARRRSHSARSTGDAGVGRCSGCCGEARNWSSSTARSRARSGLPSCGPRVWATISSRSSGPTASTVGVCRPSGFSRRGQAHEMGSSAPCAWWACTVPAGTHRARVAGATQEPASVVTASTPRPA